ncbi:LysR family transcriptional regulator [Aerococcus sp. 1KP-2016]|uniref:LysR family transcriptional regulator n=1 Tax=Aerococcus sp. 1KP-2016 TaxID=1981982 RepID=UPI000B982F35|nr:LysR family transcriptional regulator [Aerococcus sp. 1KP-2016]OYQ67958.1 LysR family transcriptional regulator [Aerococcus sp. 1KP-2016]
MDIRVLRYFLAIAREENITAAAKILHVSQPALSKQMKDLETELDSQLLIRGNRQIQLTEAGKLLKKRAQDIIALVDRIDSDIHGDHEEIVGELHIGGGESDAMRLVTAAIKHLNSEHPNIRYHLYSGIADDVMDRLDQGLLDFGLIIGTVHKQAYDFLTLPKVDTWGLLVPADSPLATDKSIHPKDLTNLPLIVSKQAFANKEFSGWYGESLDKLNIVASYNLIYNASLLVEAGLGYALALDKLVNTTGANSPLRFVPLSPQLTAPLQLIWKSHDHLSPAAKAFLEVLQQQLEG